MESFRFDERLCINCDSPLPAGAVLFCKVCKPSSYPVRQRDPHEQDIVGNLKHCDIAYITPDTVFRHKNNRLYILDSCRFYLEPHDDAKVRIKRHGGLVLIDRCSLGNYNYPWRNGEMDDWNHMILVDLVQSF